jgi:FtsZ-interacting cell division protein ZipA
MDTWVWIVIVVVAIAILALLLWRIAAARRTRGLQSTFGSEYERTVEETDSRKEAEAELRERQERRESFDIKPLSSGARDRYLRSWEQTQARFVDEPAGAVGEADELIQDVMRERGYPVEDFDQRAADLSVDHPDLVENYRAAHGVARRHVHGEADTEELRQAVVHYRALFEELLGAPSEAVES